MLNVNIKATGIELTPEISSYLNKKISALQKFITDEDTGAFANIEIGKMTNHHKLGNIFFTEINFRIGNEDFRIKAQGESLISSMDGAKDMALEAVRRDKDKKTDHQL